ncbi:uncharacterized protein LOC120545268 [Perca fluviatilis]|nr:uncharacterized protein LOC120545268 [Perca fluviatilis]XP_039635397.1 uncharacterized protein LOC120545268 [Perca fluviatilis]
MSVKGVLLKTLEDLSDEEFKKFKWFLQDPDILVGFQAIPKNQLENADRLDTVDKIIQTFSHQSVEVVKKVLKQVDRNDLVEKLSSTSPGAQDVFPRRQSEACSPTNTLLEALLSLQTSTSPQTTNLSPTTVSAPSKPTALLLNPLVDKAQNTSSKFDNITCKVLIRSGSPALYQLKPKKENIGTLTRMTLGEKNPNKNNKTILLVGETGAGKSTLVNTLVNYAMGVEWEDDVWFQIVEDEKRSQSGTQTSDVIVYQIFGFEDKILPFSLTIIDTPGYGTTDGIEHDASQRLLDLFHSVDGVHEINAVGLVITGSVNRLNDQMRYIFNSVASLFGKNMEKNIVALITHSAGVTAKNVLQVLEAAKFRCAKDEKNQPIHFLFDNSQNECRTENTLKLKIADEISIKGMSQFTDFLNITLPQNLKTTVEVLKSLIGLTDGIKKLQEIIKSIDQKQEEIKQTREALSKHKEEMNKNEKFTEEVDEVYKVKQKVGRERRWWALGLNYGGAVCCTVCEETCHYPCTLALIPEQCEIMNDGRCTVCTGKCPASVHVKEKQCIDCEGECSDESSHVKTRWKYVSKKRKVKKTEQDVKDKYEKNKAESEIKSSLFETLKKDLEGLQKDKDRLLEESFQHVVQLEQIALKVDAVSTQVDLDFLIEKMKEKGETEKKKKLEEIKRLMDKDKGIKGAMRYRFGKLREALPLKKK